MIGIFLLEGGDAGDHVLEIPVHIFIMHGLLVEARGGCGPSRIPRRASGAESAAEGENETEKQEGGPHIGKITRKHEGI